MVPELTEIDPDADGGWSAEVVGDEFYDQYLEDQTDYYSSVTRSLYFRFYYSVYDESEGTFWKEL